VLEDLAAGLARLFLDDLSAGDGPLPPLMLASSSSIRLKTLPGAARCAAMMEIRHRASLLLPWKWRIHKGRLITSGHESCASQAEAYEAGQAVRADMLAKQGHE
jgi:hypothetical protein